MYSARLHTSPSWANAVSQLSSPHSLNLRESGIQPHDLSVPIPNTNRHLSILLLDPSDLVESIAATTHSRLQHFSALTGGVDVAVIFLVNPTLPGKPNVDGNGTRSLGVRAYMQFQIDLARNPDTAGICLLPLAGVEGLGKTVNSHALALSKTQRSSEPEGEDGRRVITSLLPLCTANSVQPRLREHTVFMLTDMFPNLKALASECLSGEGEARIKRVLTADDVGGGGGRDGALVEKEADGIVQFWKDEWFVE